MVKINISFDSRSVDKELSKLIKGVSNFKEPLNSIGDDLVKFYGKDVINSQGAKSGTKWKKLSPSTLLARSKKYGYYKKKSIASNKALVWTGNLSKNFTKAVTKVRLVVGNSTDYFKYHQIGKKRPPKRPIIVLNKEVISIVMKGMSSYFKKILK